MRFILTLLFAAVTAASFAQTDSSAFFVAKGLQEKEKGRLLESYKAFDKAYSYNKDKVILTELAGIVISVAQVPASP